MYIPETTAYSFLDAKVYDPWDPEFGAGDPLREPSAQLGMLAMPPMPLGNGYYYKVGAFEEAETCLFDSRGRPTLGLITNHIVRMAHEWQAFYDEQGEQGTVALETHRQQQRLARYGVAFAYRETDVCPEGVLVRDCQVSDAVLGKAKELLPAFPEHRNHGRMWSILTPTNVGATCLAGRVRCEQNTETIDGKTTGVVRLAYSQPFSNHVPA